MARTILDLTEEEFRKHVAKKLKYLEGLIDDAFQKINDFDENTRTLAEESKDHAARAQRMVRRMKSDFEGHTHPHKHKTDAG